MERVIMGALVIAAIVAVVVLDVIGVGWTVHRLWRSRFWRRLRH